MEMACVSDLTRTDSLVWVTDKPFMDVSRRSSNFWLQDRQSYLELDVYCSKYSLNLHCVDGFSQLPLTVIAVVYGRSREYSFCNLERDVENTSSKSRLILNCERGVIDKALNQEGYLGKLTICCVFISDQPFTVRLSGSETGHPSEALSDRPLRLTSDGESLSNDLNNLLEQKLYTDVQLRCGSRTFPAHRNILTARSEVFAAMFRNKMAESETGTVDVTDMDAQDLDVLLKYVYSGKLPELSCDAACNLYAAGDKYRILALRQACSELMAGGLTIDNCLPLLVLADAHSDEAFKDRVVNFVAENLELIQKETWFGFNKDFPVLANSVYQKSLETKLSKQP